MDVEALYPSIDHKAAAEIVKEEYMTSNVEVEEVDWRMVVLYLAVTVEKTELIKEGIYHLTARRSTNVRGRRPTVRTPKVSGPLKKEERRNRGDRGRERPRYGWRGCA